jgi:hypothetical protein
MNRINFLPPWVETNLQPAFYDKESGTVLQQTARMYARVNMLIRMFNKLSRNTKTTVEDYINRFNELYTYVHDYFDNLDVQEEINNKLDQMLEDGVLQEIILQFLQTNAVWCFDSVADMKASSNLISGSYAKTLGYYNKDDLGGSTYKITDSLPSGHYEVLTNGLYAELQIENNMNILQFGVQDDTASINYTTTIQKALKSGVNNLTFNAGTYTITAGLQVECSVYGSSTGKTIISFPTADPTKYSLVDSIFIINDQYNIEVKGINFIGSFSDENPGPINGTSEHAHAFALKNAHDITIRDCNANKIFGDFAYVGGGRVGEAHEGKSTNIVIENCVVSEIKRMLVSCIHCDRIFISGCTINKQHTNVAIVDIEPNDTNQQATNVVIKDNYITTNGNVFNIDHSSGNRTAPGSVVIVGNFIKHCSNLFTTRDPYDENHTQYIESLVLENNYVEEITQSIFGTDTRIRGVKNGVVKGNTIPQPVLISYSKNLIVEGNKVDGFTIQNSEDVNINGNYTKYVTIRDSESIALSNNTIKRGSYTYDNNCIWIRSGSKINIMNNLMSLARYVVRIQLDGNVDGLVIKNNTIVTSQYGVYVNPTSTYTATNMDLCDNIVFNSQQGDSETRTLVPVFDQINKQYDTSNYFKMSGLGTNTSYYKGLKGQYVKNTNPTLLSDATGSYYLKGWLCVDAENQTWIADKLRV